MVEEESFCHSKNDGRVVGIHSVWLACFGWMSRTKVLEEEAAGEEL